MGFGLAKSIAAMSGVSASVGYAIEELNRQLIEGPDVWSRMKQDLVVLDEQRTMSVAEYHKVFSEQLCSLGKRPDESQARRRSKKKRGHNHDRDRVIGGKAGYC